MSKTVRVRVLDIDNKKGRGVYLALGGPHKGKRIVTRWDPGGEPVTVQPGDEDELQVVGKD